MALNSHVTTVVRSVKMETPRIARFELSCSDYWELPPFSGGAHIDVVLPNGELRQYSLCGDPADRLRYHIAVAREDAGRGGSLAMHEHVTAGSILPVSIPRKLFGLSPSAGRHVFIAGGIGITPFISMIAELERKGGDYLLHYCSRSRADIAFLAMLAPRAALGKVHFYYPGLARLDLAQLVSAREAGDHLYCCGPQSLLDGFLAATASLPGNTIHFERFGKDPSIAVAPPYEVFLAKSQRTITVHPHQSLAGALMAAGAPLKVACEAGVCGTCTVSYLAGTPIHRDLILSSAERCQVMTPCVSCGSNGGLIVDL